MLISGFLVSKPSLCHYTPGPLVQIHSLQSFVPPLSQWRVCSRLCESGSQDTSPRSGPAEPGLADPLLGP